MKTAQVTVAATATKIADANGARRVIIVTNHGTTDVFLGNDATVTTTTGLLLAGTKGAQVRLEDVGAVYGIVGTGTQVVSYEESNA